MKKISLIVLLFGITFGQCSSAQDSTTIQPLTLLSSYYSLKDALVSSNSSMATFSAEELIKAINSADKKLIKDETRTALLSDAAAISQTKDLNLQREKFASLSANMVALAKKVKLSTEPVYQQYCPMKKASWLSNSTAIKNPYYGNAMLTCGSVRETF
jgi:hypothetical protein